MRGKPSLTPHPKQGLGFAYVQGCSLHHLSGYLFQCSMTLIVKTFFFFLLINFHLLQFDVHCPLSCCCTLSKCLALYSLHLPFSFSLSLLFSRVNKLSSLTSPCMSMGESICHFFSSASLAQTTTAMSKPLTSEMPLDSLQYAHVCLILGSPALDPALQMFLTRLEKRGVSPVSTC